MLNSIEDRFRPNALYDGALLILTKQDAIGFVKACRTAGVPIRRIEGYRLLPGGRIMPSREHSADYSGPEAARHITAPEQVYADAHTFLRDMPDSLGFEITCGNRPMVN